jgi:hypothetical protein
MFLGAPLALFGLSFYTLYRHQYLIIYSCCVTATQGTSLWDQKSSWKGVSIHTISVCTLASFMNISPPYFYSALPLKSRSISLLVSSHRSLPLEDTPFTSRSHNKTTHIHKLHKDNMR